MLQGHPGAPVPSPVLTADGQRRLGKAIAKLLRYERTNSSLTLDELLLGLRHNPRRADVEQVLAADALLGRPRFARSQRQDPASGWIEYQWRAM